MAQGPASVTNRHALGAMSMSGRTANRQLTGEIASNFNRV